MYDAVPLLPVLVPSVALVGACLLLVSHRRGQLTPTGALLRLAACVYGAGIAANTVFPIYLGKPASTTSWTTSWTTKVDLVPLVDYEPVDAVTNVVVFLPLGVVLAVLVGRSAPWRVVVVATAVSLGIELTQLLTAVTLGGGHVADVDDLLCNVLGACLGLGLVLALQDLRRRRVTAAPQPPQPPSAARRTGSPPGRRG
jgi:glycopeptide antibiotics resistance protein